MTFNMKKAIFIVLACLIISSYAYAEVFESIENREKVIVTMISQEPDPVEPGNVVEVRFRIESLRSDPLKNVQTKIVTKYPFSIYPGDVEIKDIGTLTSGRIEDVGVRVKFKVLVDTNAPEGENEIEFWYGPEGKTWVKGGEFSVDIGSRDAFLAINEISTNPAKIVPGTETNVAFKIENMAGSVLKNIKLKLGLLNTIVAGSTIDKEELPFTPVGSGNEKSMKIIGTGESKEMSFKLFTDSGAESKMYKVPYSLAYTDEAGANFTRTGILGLIVDSEPDISVSVEESGIYTAGVKGDVSIKFVNKGFSDIKFLNVKLMESEDFDITSNEEFYIGSIDSDDYETAEFELIANTKDALMLPISISYRDANGNPYSYEVNKEIKLYSGKALELRQGKQGNSFVGILVMVAIVAAGIYIYRRKKRKH